MNDDNIKKEDIYFEKPEASYVILITFEIFIIAILLIYIYLKRKKLKENYCSRKNEKNNNLENNGTNTNTINDEINGNYPDENENENEKNSIIFSCQSEETKQLNLQEKLKTELKYQYLLILCIARSCIWLKAPYIILNFINLGYSITSITLLYFLDLLTALILGPFLGNLSDIYGRKKLSSYYFIFTCFDMLLKIYGWNIGIIFSTFLNGITTVLIHNTFESWINFKSWTVCNSSEERMRFLKSTFKDYYIYDSICAVICTLVSIFLYVSFNLN